MAQDVLGFDDDRGIFLLARQMVEIDHQLEVRIADRLDEGKSLGGGVDDVALLAPERLDEHRDAARPRLRSDPLAEIDELRERLVLAEPVGHAARAAAAEDERLDTHPGKPIERFLHVGHLLIAIDRGAGHLERAGKKEIRGRRRQSDPLDVVDGLVEVGIGERGELRRAELDVVEPRGFRCREIFQAGALPDLDTAILSKAGREQRDGEDDTGTELAKCDHGRLKRPKSAALPRT